MSVRFSAKGVRMPVNVEKTLTIEAGSGVLTLEEAATNEGEEPVELTFAELIGLESTVACDLHATLDGVPLIFTNPIARGQSRRPVTIRVRTRIGSQREGDG